MAGSSEADRLQALEARLKALEGGTAEEGGGDQPDAQAGLIQAFLQGALVGNAAAQSAASGGGDGGTGAAFLSIFGCGGGGGGWSPTNYDSVFWCRSRFMCNPSSISCLC
jgi:hypothetical protein